MRVEKSASREECEWRRVRVEKERVEKECE